LEIRQQQVFHFPLRDPENELPVFVHKDDMQMYGLPSGRDVAVPAVKIGRFDDGLVTTASTRSGRIDDRYRRPVIDYVRRWLPALEPEPVAEASCLFTMTPTEDFVLDRVGNIVIASACSGHGAKFAPLTGLFAAELALRLREPESRFSLASRRRDRRSDADEVPSSSRELPSSVRYSS
jgi:sarcosine oxidase